MKKIQYVALGSLMAICLLVGGLYAGIMSAIAPKPHRDLIGRFTVTDSETGKALKSKCVEAS